jgi:mannose-1-phosphate guanylyltransferase
MQQLKAVILVGGLGTRLRPLTYEVPKSVVPVLNRPFMEHTFAYLKHHGIKDIILTLNYLPEVIHERFGDGEQFGVRLTYCLEKEPLGTAGAVKNAAEYLDNSFFVFNGDVFTDLDLSAMYAYHREKKAKATISLNWEDNPAAFGVVETDSNQRVQRFIEKPPLGTETTNWINAGTYILEPEILDYIPPDIHYMFEKGLFPDILTRGEPVYGYPHRGYWLDMGTPEKYFALNRDLMLSKVDSLAFPAKQRKGITVKDSAEIDSSAVVTPPVIVGSGSRIGRGVKVTGPVIFGRDCQIMEGAQISDAIIWDGVKIGIDARVNKSIISSNSKIDGGQVIENLVYTPSKSAPLTQ